MSADIDALIARLSPPGSELARDVIAALAAQQARIAELTEERADWARRFNLNGVTPWEWMTRALSAEVEADAESEMTDEWRTRAERAEARVKELSEVWTDDSGATWTPPTAWAYAQACKALHKAEAEIIERRLVEADLLERKNIAVREREKAEAALRQAPTREPTTKMLIAAADYLPGKFGLMQWASIWRAMYDAAQGEKP